MADKQSKEMAKLAYDALADKKAQDIKIINIELTDNKPYFYFNIIFQ